ncbi:MAG: polymerase delta prime subunit [Candidatus Levybacteria bacterium]|nr:polymerase delta prime subunit [Candidatus Levybacteria bacterium]
MGQERKEFMQSFLIASLDKNLSASYAANLLKEKNVDSLDINLHVYEKAMGIENVREIQKAILLKPFRGKTKAVVIEAYEDITPQAQNALLKILEEPPNNTIIVITTAKKELLLPTIISRCKVIVLQEKEIKLVQNELSKFHETLNILLNGGSGDKLKIAQDITRDKGDAALWLEKMAVFVKNKLTENNKDLKYLNFLKELQKTYKVIKSTNVSQRTTLENHFLSI